MQRPYLLYETASFHGGNSSKLLEIVDVLTAQNYIGSRGIKFHPISAEALANADFYAFPIYKELELTVDVWAGLIKHAAMHLDVWLEMADHNCADVLIMNRGKIEGVKFQSSMIENDEVLERLKDAEPQTLRVILNVSGLSLTAIESCLARFAAIGFSKRNIMLQVGFQGYPTQVGDTMLNKIAVLAQAFPGCSLAFADHVSAEDPFASVAPVLAAALGCELIEKHACLGRDATAYDRYSALEPSEMDALARMLEKTSDAFADRFICDAEARYLGDSVLQPCLAHPMRDGQLVSRSDLLFRRQGKAVLTLEEIRSEQARGRVLAHNHEAREGLSTPSYREARIGVVVACRMKSTRLKNKPILPIHGKAALERCLENCLLFPRSPPVILATSTHPNDAVLENYTLSGRVGFFKGDPDDVLRRYLDVAEREHLDVIIRVTADNPVVSPEIAGLLMDSHLATGADFTRAAVDAVGTGVHIINVEAMQRVMAFLGGAPLSEYMNWYFENNPEIFKINIVDLPAELVRDYRLTLDYASDLEMFSKLFLALNEQNMVATTKNVFSVLDASPDIRSLNMGETIIYQANQSLIEDLKSGTKIDAAKPDV